MSAALIGGRRDLSQEWVATASSTQLPQHNLPRSSSRLYRFYSWCLLDIIGAPLLSALIAAARHGSFGR